MSPEDFEREKRELTTRLTRGEKIIAITIGVQFAIVMALAMCGAALIGYFFLR